jgi:type II secretory pathway component PulF
MWSEKHGRGRANASTGFKHEDAGVSAKIWLKYQVAQFSRILMSTLLVGGIPLVQALETAANGHRQPADLHGHAGATSPALVKEGQSLSAALSFDQACFPPICRLT